MPIPSMQDYLPTIGFEARPDQESGITSWFDTSSGDLNKVSDTGRLSDIYTSAFPQDTGGNYIYGTAGYTPGRTQGNVSLNGQNYIRTGGSYADIAQKPEFADVFRQAGIGASDITYDPTYGYISPESRYTQAASGIGQAGRKNDFWSKLSGALTYAPLALGLAGTGAGLLGGFGGAGGLGEGATSGAAASGEIAGGTGGFGGSATELAQLGANPYAASGFLQSYPGMSTFAGAGGTGALSPLQLLEAGAAPGAAGVGGYGLGGAGDGTGLQLPPGTGTGSGYGLESPANQLGLQNTSTAGTPLGGSTMGGGGISSGASSLGEWTPSLLDNLSQQVIGSLSDPKQLLSRLATSIMGGPGGGGTGGSGTGILGNPLGSALSFGSGIYGLIESRKLRQLAQQQAAAADPFGAYRPQFAAQLAELGADPSKLTQTPGYNAGLQAVERRMASQGYNGSGNMMTALAKYGGDFYQQEMSRLAGLAGANLNPANASSILLNGTSGSIDLAGRSLASIGYGVGQNQNNPNLQQLLQLAMLGAR